MVEFCKLLGAAVCLAGLAILYYQHKNKEE